LRKDNKKIIWNYFIQCLVSSAKDKSNNKLVSRGGTLVLGKALKMPTLTALAANEGDAGAIVRFDWD
jgi:hypothetical protein